MEASGPMSNDIVLPSLGLLTPGWADKIYFKKLQSNAV